MLRIVSVVMRTKRETEIKLLMLIAHLKINQSSIFSCPSLEDHGTRIEKDRRMQVKLGQIKPNN